jgi:hypothetical protein
MMFIRLAIPRFGKVDFEIVKGWEMKGGVAVGTKPVSLKNVWY